jgi:hypothetical protein
MPIAPGIVVVDSTFLKQLKAPDAVRKIETNMRAAHLTIALSVPNVVEALKHPNKDIRAELLAAIRRWSRTRPLNPWPLDLLRLAGEALPNIEFTFGPDQIDVLLDRPDELIADHEKAVRYLEGLETRFAEPYERNRPELQRALRELGLRDAWPTVGEFLESAAWIGNQNQTSLIAMVWELAGLSAPPPTNEVVRTSEVWRLVLDVFGTAIFTRALKAKRVANPPGFVDLFQWLYLSEHTRARILLSDDKSLREASSEALLGRYSNVRIMSGDDFLRQAL